MTNQATLVPTELFGGPADGLQCQVNPAVRLLLIPTTDNFRVVWGDLLPLCPTFGRARYEGTPGSGRMDYAGTEIEGE